MEKRSQTFYDSEKFITFIKLLLENSRKEAATFVLDNAPIHQSKLTREFFHKENLDILFLPTYSPDLNPIETVWAHYKRRFHKIIATKKARNIPPMVMESINETEK